MTEETWFCEDCGEEQTGEPEHKETFKGYEGNTVELWFCEDCKPKHYTRF